MKLVGLFALAGAAFAVFCIHRQPDMVLPYGMSALVMLGYAIRAFAWKEPQ